MLHLTCGDLAGDGVRNLLADREPGAEVRVLRDDLAVGPLSDVDSPPCAARVAFWEQLWPDELTPRPLFAHDLAADARWLAELAGQADNVIVWHGDSASEQLLLARVCAALQGCRLQEVACGTGDSRAGRRKAVSMHSPEALAALYRPQAVSVSRQTELAAVWHQQCAGTYGIRRWDNGTFSGEDYQLIDATLIAASPDEFAPLARAMADVMGHCDGFFATDLFLYWRARELTTAGHLEVRGDPAAGYRDLQVRRR
ncbi:DUF1835 domain-containing protein [Stutzerimonas stutzeri]|uniref:DUF1835 domain-containing protein n=1 Tax=Stutzerimonas stutzeri TaxID=316 RepID=UPI000315D278|nr:DUF1835 domain-containing protein [Stutzerimonas stutzeri]RRV78667.1 DUF1835 domain-containing protein [Stutzerimonas stutzeri]